MGLFVCEKCECVENTALGQYWASDSNIFPPPYNGKQLCSECGSPTYRDGGKTKYGVWHGKFPKTHILDYLEANPDSSLQYLKKKYQKESNNGTENNKNQQEKA